ncbi:DNRLRE domain-containing protein [Micromonospora sp. CPCC 205371]|nr:DNRLRE domain-containing protein [Micromonospora sp. CPCC 205371]
MTPEAMAAARARAIGRPVEVPSSLTETTRVLANPDGTFTAEVHVGPTRFKDSTGLWRDVDLTLERRADGSVAPKAHPRGLSLSGAVGAGDHDVAKLASGGTELALGWRGALPEPQIEGTRAVYAAVRPGIDLVVEVTRTGFEQLLVVRDRASAAGLNTIEMPWRTKGLTPSSTSDGGLELRDANGMAAAHVPGAEMWDATVSLKSGERSRRARLPMRVKASRAASGTDLALAPPDTFLKDPATKYPVTIDPAPTLKPGFDAFVQTGYNTDQSTDTELKLGYSEEDDTTARSFLRWSTSFLAGKQVTAATLYLWNHWSWSCRAAKWQVWITGSVGTGTRWTSQPTWGGSGYPVAESTMTKGWSSDCGDGWVTANVKDTFQYAADQRWTQLTTGLRASQTDENNHNTDTWKRFSSSEGSKDPYVSITYNTAPNAAANLTIGGKACGTGSSRPFISRTPYHPSMQAKLTDPDGTERSLTGQFFVAPLGQALPGSPTISQSGVTSGNYATKQIPAAFTLSENATYYFQVRTWDGLASSWSAVCEFTVDSVGPAVPPTVTSTTNPECLPSACDTGGSVGTAGAFTFGANGVSDVVKYRYWWDGHPKVEVPAASPGTSVTVPISPPALTAALHLDDLTIGGQRVLHVESVDPAGRASPEYRNMAQPDNAVGYSMLVGSAHGPAAWWRMDDPAGSSTYVDSSGNNRNLTSGSALPKQEIGYGDGGSAFTFAESTASRGVFLDAPSNLTVSAWAKLTDAGTDRTVLRQYTATLLPGTINNVQATSIHLYYQSSTNLWCFTTSRTRTPSAAQGDFSATTCAAMPARLGVWTHLVAVHEAATHEVALYVNGRASSATPGAPVNSVFVATGMRIGNGNFVGDIDDVRVWQRQLDPREIGALSSTEAGRWDLDGTGLDSSASPTPHDVAELPSGLTWDEVGHLDSDPGAVQFNGVDQAMVATGPVLRTDQSFSVSAWVQLYQMPGWHQSAVTQDGTNNSGFFFGSRNYSEGKKWSFAMTNTDVGNGGGWVDAKSTAVITEDDEGRWVHLVGVYDAAAQQIRLYVDGQLIATAARTARWQANGPLAIGRAQWAAGGVSQPSDWFNGSVDAVRVYAGVLTTDMVTRLYETTDGVL